MIAIYDFAERGKISFYLRHNWNAKNVSLIVCTQFLIMLSLLFPLILMILLWKLHSAKMVFFSHLFSFITFGKVVQCWWIRDSNFECNFLTLIACLRNLSSLLNINMEWEKRRLKLFFLRKEELYFLRTMQLQFFFLRLITLNIIHSTIFQCYSKKIGRRKRRKIHSKWINKLCSCNSSLYRDSDFSSTWLLMMNFQMNSWAVITVEMSATVLFFSSGYIHATFIFT